MALFLSILLLCMMRFYFFKTFSFNDFWYFDILTIFALRTCLKKFEIKYYNRSMGLPNFLKIFYKSVDFEVKPIGCQFIRWFLTQEYSVPSQSLQCLTRDLSLNIPSVNCQIQVTVSLKTGKIHNFPFQLMVDPSKLQI